MLDVSFWFPRTEIRIMGELINIWFNFSLCIPCWNRTLWLFFLKGDLIFLFPRDSEGIFLPQKQSQIVITYYNFSPFAIVDMYCFPYIQIHWTWCQKNRVLFQFWFGVFLLFSIHVVLWLTAEKINSLWISWKRWSDLGFNNREQERFLFQR